MKREQKQCHINVAQELLNDVNHHRMPPDLAPCDFFLFPKLKKPMKGKRFATIDEIKSESKKELRPYRKRISEVIRGMYKTQV